MPTKGFFTQSACILLKKTISLDRLAKQLSSFTILRQEPSDQPSWISGNNFVLLGFRKEANGLLMVDIVEKSWPDPMGDPKSDMELFGAWSMGYFGPFAFPGNLERALQHCYRCPELEETAPTHTAFIRMRISYILGAGEDALVIPEDYKAVPELLMITDVAEKLLKLPEAICYFNPNGETLYTLEEIRRRREHYARNRHVPLDLWCNVRNFSPDVPGWFLMDLIGMQQLDLPDQEIYAPEDDYDRSDAAALATDIAIYLAENGPIIELNNTIDGPGGKWRVRAITDSKVIPTRPVMRWFPDTSKPPKKLLKP
jgi:hypothetical protein